MKSGRSVPLASCTAKETSPGRQASLPYPPRRYLSLAILVVQERSLAMEHGFVMAQEPSAEPEALARLQPPFGRLPGQSPEMQWWWQTVFVSAPHRQLLPQAAKYLRLPTGIYRFLVRLRVRHRSLRQRFGFRTVLQRWWRRERHRQTQYGCGLQTAQLPPKGSCPASQDLNWMLKRVLMPSERYQVWQQGLPTPMRMYRQTGRSFAQFTSTARNGYLCPTSQTHGVRPPRKATFGRKPVPVPIRGRPLPPKMMSGHNNLLEAIHGNESRNLWRVAP